MTGHETHGLDALLRENPYPGRGIVLGQTADGTKDAAAYFIMGRSENSRNRVFVETADGIRTVAHDQAKVTDPSLILYHPVRRVGDTLIVANGDQSDTIRDVLAQGGTFEAALATREFEPDAPNFTPRISGILYPDGAYALSILKSADAAGSACARCFFYYPPIPGTGHFLHTYQHDGTPLPPFCGEPRRVVVPNDLGEFAALIWKSLHPEHKIALYVRFADLRTGAAEYRIWNKHEQGGRI